ncbi:hypothetical protein GOP47_0001325 [Adiantum capillus-veneris]|uniref:AFG1-like ATPase n=1 Tax=Adiantum capillus-veneris TaxID=13818 RepID=A0A9D4V9V2_ADICA|nr:hypothetical protein GOP47_0001325 [Adiantum capillus-veneris]
MARAVICKKNCKFIGGAIGLVQNRDQAIFPSHHASRLLDGSTFSSGSATVLEGQPVATIDGQQNPAKAGPLYQYERRVELGELMAGDRNQEQALKTLQTLYDGLVENAAAMELEDAPTYHDSRQRSWLWTSFLSKGRQKVRLSVRGLYLYGGVGTGKTMLMDLFFEELPKKWKKRRTHFHDFMLNVHSRLQKQKGMADPLQVVAEELSKEAILLCLDEFMVTDVADALILNRLFGHLFERGMVLVTTSNRAPDKLYEGGLQRDLFLPFIALLKARCIVHEIGSSVDYRKLNANEEGFFFYGEGAGSLLKEKFRLITDGNLARPTVVEVVMGRKLQVPFAANGCAYFQFHELCEMPLGAADYIGLFNKFHTLALEGIPSFGSHNRVAAYRFVTLIDVMYENRARLLCSAEDEPVGLFKRCVTIADAPKPRDSRAVRNDDADLCVDNELGFAKERTISRLTEMISRPYLEEHAAMIAEKIRQQEEKGD